MSSEVRPPKKRRARLPQAHSSQLNNPSSSGECQSCLRETPLAAWAHRRERLGHCRVCVIAVGNKNLGGFSGRSALSGRLFCSHCEDVGGCL
jgi:hypothetical protein